MEPVIGNDAFKSLTRVQQAAFFYSALVMARDFHNWSLANAFGLSVHIAAEIQEAEDRRGG